MTLATEHGIELMDGVFESLKAFHPFRLSPLVIAVPNIADGQWGSGDDWDLLGEIAEISGVDSELWSEDDQGYWILEHPEAPTWTTE